MTSASGSPADPYAGQGINRSFYLPRLAPELYQGNAVVHWTVTLKQRQAGWLNSSFHSQFREMMLHAAARESLICPTYCLMPDHLHLVWMGLQRASDQRHAMKFFREQLGRLLHPLEFQHQAHDHVLREAERQRQAFRKVCFYITANPKVAELVSEPKDWPYTGAIVPGYPTLHPLAEEFWPIFWKRYAATLAPDAGYLKRPKTQ